MAVSEREAPRPVSERSEAPHKAANGGRPISAAAKPQRAPLFLARRTKIRRPPRLRDSLDGRLVSVKWKALAIVHVETDGIVISVARSRRSLEHERNRLAQRLHLRGRK